ncbi:MAG: ATP-dependent helicase [Bacteroidota bacterium]
MARRFVLKSEPTPDASSPPEAALTLDYAGSLNEQQYAAATAPGGPTLIVAGAGTGKTRTLVWRVAYLIETGTPPEQVVLLTFTRRAAREMLNRAADLLDGRAQRVRGGTFHSFCLQILRIHAEKIGYPKGFTLLDAADASDVIDLIRTERGLGAGRKRFPKKRTLQAMFSATANRALRLDDVVEAKYPQFLVHLDDLDALQTAFADYKRRHGLMDYDDLLLQTQHLFQQHPDTARQVSAGCRHVLVDEYQDTNRMQADLVRHFAAVHGNVTAVGDDAQSIYRFRGADFRNILDFPTHFPGTKLYKLEENYRSTQPILDLANRVLEQAQEKYDKTLFTEKQTGELPALVQAPDDAWQSKFVCQVVLEEREGGTPLNRMAVLFRSGYNSYDLETELNRRRIPFVKFGGLKLNEAAHVKDVLAHLRVAENPADAVAWNRVLRLLDGIGPKTAAQLVEWIAQAEDPYTLDAPFVSPRFVEEIKRLAALLQALRAADERSEGDGLPVQLETLLGYYEPILARTYTEDHPKRQQDLDHVAGLAEGYASRGDFLEALTLDPIDLTALDAEASLDDEPPLVLSTIHSAKGLEFDSVFLIQALDGVIPSQYSLGSDAEIDEELRLLYVAVTRAERQLFVSYPMLQRRRRTGDFFARPTRFLDGLPETVLEPWTLVQEQSTPPPQLPEGSEDTPKQLGPGE